MSVSVPVLVSTVSSRSQYRYLDHTFGPRLQARRLATLRSWGQNFALELEGFVPFDVTATTVHIGVAVYYYYSASKIWFHLLSLLLPSTSALPFITITRRRRFGFV